MDFFNGHLHRHPHDHHGGSDDHPFNNLENQGANNGFAREVGTDDDGRALIQDFEKVGVDTSQVRVKPGTKTGAVLCLTDSLGRRSLYVSPGANNLLTMDDLDLAYLNQSALIHISSFADDRQFQVLLALMDRLDSSTKVTFAPGVLHASKGLKELKPILKRTYVLLINHHEIQHLTGKDVIAGAEICLNCGCQIVAVTLGSGMRLALGSERDQVMAVSYIRDNRSGFAIKPPEDKIEVVDSTGAGDAFAAGFLYGLLNNKGLETCGQLGDTVARFCLTCVGARPGLPTLKKLAQCYRELYNQAL